MTAIANILTHKAIACATDSYLTGLHGEVIEARRPKLLYIVPLKTVVAFWGLAKASDGFDALDYLKKFAVKHKAIGSVSAFASELAVSLSARIARMQIPSPLNGLGIHLASMENVGGEIVPELFLCTNYADQNYKSTNAKFSATRETGGKTDDPQMRLEYFRELQSGKVSIFNNGDPELFVPVANAVMQMSTIIQKRGLAHPTLEIDLYRSWVREPIKTIKVLQQRLCKKGKRLVGGAIHDLIVYPNGSYVASSQKVPVIH